MTKRALILVDIQNDFMPGGALAVNDGNAVVAVANSLVPKFDLIFATQDWHPANHGSFAENQGEPIGSLGTLGGLPQVMWPVHCVQHSNGARFVDGLDIERARVVQKGTDPEIDSYSGFFDNGKKKETELNALLKENDVTDLFILGVATDYCVAYTALDAKDLGYNTYVVTDGCRGVDLDPGDVERAIQQFRDRGIQLLQSKEVIDE